MPDLTILLDLPVEAGLARKSAEVTRFEAYHDLAYHERVRAAFLAFAADEPERYAIVDAVQPAAAVLAAAVGARRVPPGLPRPARRACGAVGEPIGGRGTHATMSDARLEPAAVPGLAPVPTDEELLAGLADGRLEALDALYERYKTMAYGIARRITADDALAEDVVQDAFLGAWRGADRYVPGGAACGRGCSRSSTTGRSTPSAAAVRRPSCPSRARGRPRPRR